jgi:uncharacterized protein with beta-barrel porin domain
MRYRAIRGTLLATSSALALIIAVDQGAEAAQCTVVTNPGLPRAQSGNTCVNFIATPAGAGDVNNNGTVTASGTTVNHSGTGVNVYIGATVNGGITNNGTINANLVGIQMDQGSITGSVVNAAGALISSNSNGINLEGEYGVPGEGVGGSVINNGTINTITVNANAGMSVGAITVGGGVTNNGTITSGLAAMVVSESTVAGNVVNGVNAKLSAAATVGLAISNGGSIGGSVENFGTISEAQAFGAAIQILPSTGGIAQTIGGSVINESGGTLTGSVGIAAIAFIDPSTIVTIHGDVVNNGTINAGLTGIQALSATVGGAVSNGGTITAGQYGIQLVNLAKASGGTTLGSSGPTTVAGGVVNSGSITSNGTGFAGIGLNGATVSNGITNSLGGTITATNGVGILLSNTGQVTFTGGTQFTVSGGASSVTGGINNAGTITAQTGIAVTGGSTVDGITNSGTITGSTAAIDLTGEGAATTIAITGGAVNGNMIGGGVGFGDTLNFNTGGAFTYTSAISAMTTVNVDSGTTLYDNNAITATTVNVLGGAKLSAGTAGTPGTLTITGNLAFASGAVYLVQVNPANASLINVSGSATLTGATANAMFSPGSYMTKSYEILTSGARIGTFAGLTTTAMPADVTASLSYQGNNVFLDLTAAIGGGNSTPLNGNEQAVANALNNYFNSGGALPPNFQTIFNLTDGALARALQQLDGEASTDAEASTFQLMNQFLNLMLDPFVDGRSGSPGSPLSFAPDQQPSLPPDIAMAYDSVLKAPPKPTFEQRWTAWAAGYAGTNQTSGDPTVGSTTFNASTYGYAAGMDYHVAPDAKLGFALSGGGTNWNLQQALGGGRSDSFMAGVYGIKYFGAAYIAGDLAGGNNWFTTSRTAPLGDQLRATFQGQSFGARVEAGYRYAMQPAFAVTPYGAVQVESFHTPSYSESDLTGGGFGLSYASQSATDTRSELGARFDDLTVLGNMPLILRARVAWAHDWASNPNLTAVFQALPGANFVVNGAPIVHDSALGTLGSELKVTQNWSLLTKVDGDFAKGSQTYGGTATARYTW